MQDLWGKSNQKSGEACPVPMVTPRPIAARARARVGGSGGGGAGVGQPGPPPSPPPLPSPAGPAPPARRPPPSGGLAAGWARRAVAMAAAAPMEEDWEPLPLPSRRSPFYSLKSIAFSGKAPRARRPPYPFERLAECSLETSSSFSWVQKACRGPQCTGRRVKNGGVRIHRIRDFKQFYFDSIPPTSHLTRAGGHESKLSQEALPARRRARDERRRIRWPGIVLSAVRQG